GAVLDISYDAGAVIDAGHTQCFLRAGTPWPDRHIDAGGGLNGIDHLCGAHDQAALPDSGGNPVVNLGGHAVPVRIPPRLAVAQEQATEFFRPVLPNLLVEGPQTIDNVAPVAARLFVGFDPRPKPGKEARGLLAQRYFVFTERYRVRQDLALRQQTTARDHRDGAAMMARLQRQKSIHHAEAAAENEHRSLAIETRVFGAVHAHCDFVALKRLDVMPRRQNHLVGLERFPRGKFDAHARNTGDCGDDLVVDDLQPAGMVRRS